MPALSEVELAALDLIIALKKSGAAPAGFINANLSVNNLGDVAVAAASIAAVAAAVGLAPTYSSTVSPSIQPATELTLQELMDIRANAVKAQKP